MRRLLADVIDFTAVFLIGASVAVGELISRYKDDPLKAIFSVAAGLYVVVNGAAAFMALAIIRVFNWDFGVTQDELRVTQVLLAGFGAVALFRTSLFNMTVGDQVVGIGPSVLLNVWFVPPAVAAHRRFDAWLPLVVQQRPFVARRPTFGGIWWWWPYRDALHPVGCG